MKTSTEMVEQIGKLEGLRLRAYKCPAGVWTIGYGTTMIDGKPVTKDMVISEAKAVEYLRRDLEIAERAVDAMGVHLCQNQFDALVDFVYNCGSGNFHQSTLRKKVIGNPYNPSIKKEFVRWNKATVNGVKQVLPGLTKRREIEAAWYTYGSTYKADVDDITKWIER